MAAPQLWSFRDDGASTQSRLKSLSDLPDEVLVVLMQHVPLQQRLVGCARLSSQFRRASAAATTAIKHHAASMGTVYGLQAYLQSHGTMVASLDLKPPMTALQRLPFSLQRLPCPGLLKLQLTDTLVQLTAIPGSQQPGILSSCTALTSLCLLNCNVLDPSQQLGGLSVLQDLQELVVRWDSDSTRRASQPLSLLPGSLLSQLVGLTHVHLAETMRFASLEHLSCLTDLQQFRVVLAADAKQERFSGLHELQHLTSLGLDCYQSQQSMGFMNTRCLYRATSLQELDVWACKAFSPSVLKEMTSLQRLIVRKASSLPRDARGTSSWLQVLPRLTAVTRLDLSGTLQHPAVQLEDYTALACLSNLVVLDLSDCVLPAGMWQQLAQAGMPMRSVRSLAINNCTAEPLDTDGLSSLVKCFPSLAYMSCVQSTQDSIQWTALQQLPYLKTVHINGITDAAAPVLASLQRLTTLKIMSPSSITDLGLLQLTALSRLEHLQVSGNLSCLLANGDPLAAQSNLDIKNWAPAGQVPDVAKHLLRLCIRSSRCQPVLLAQMSDMESDLQDTRKELVAAKAALSNSKGLLESQRAQRAQLESLLASAQAAPRQAAILQVREAAAARLETKLTCLEASLKVKEGKLQARVQNAVARERKTAAAVANVAANKAECDERWRQIEARELAAAGLERQLRSQGDALKLQSDRQERLEASLEAREQDLELLAGSNSAILQLVERERKAAAAAAKAASREAWCADESQQLDRRLQAIVDREQQVAATQKRLDARSSRLNWDEQQLRQAQQALKQSQAEMQKQQQVTYAPHYHGYNSTYRR